jgi:hypothetical protein
MTAANPHDYGIPAAVREEVTHDPGEPAMTAGQIEYSFECGKTLDFDRTIDRPARCRRQECGDGIAVDGDRLASRETLYNTYSTSACISRGHNNHGPSRMQASIAR